MTHIHPFRLFVFLLLCCTRVITFAQSDSYQTIPESLRGYWQYKTENVSDWNGPLIGENFVEALYTVSRSNKWKRKPMEAISSTCGTKMEIKWISVSPLSAKIVLSSSIKAGKNLNTVSASKFPTTRKCLLPLHCLTSFTRNGWKDCPAMLYTNLHAMVNLYMTEKHGISYLPDISLIKSIVCSPKTENGTNCFTLAFLFPTQ